MSSSSKKDMRRADLIIPYIAPKDKEGSAGDISSTAASTLPMMAMFTRNKYIGWTSVVVALQNYLADSGNSSSGTPPMLTLGMAFMSVAVTYLPLFMPTQPRGPLASA